jgi:hypothetical protein
MPYELRHIPWDNGISLSLLAFPTNPGKTQLAKPEKKSWEILKS